MQPGPSSASLLNLPDAVQATVQAAGNKVPSVSDLAQGDAPLVPGREFPPPKSLDEQLGAAKDSGKLELPDPLKTMEAPGGGGAVGEQLDKTRAAIQENLPGPKDLTPGALRDRVVGEALTPQSPSVQMQR
ncbi:hypothetical protein WJX81_002781 [Elliptochloris bilobata]|uniref:Uncharacterized protein n=1 Tax=Elliptochloris bilobata TaxID=381761 RepID=A0AAW1QLD3_9CHLO